MQKCNNRGSNTNLWGIGYGNVSWVPVPMSSHVDATHACPSLPTSHPPATMTSGSSCSSPHHGHTATCAVAASAAAPKTRPPAAARHHPCHSAPCVHPSHHPTPPPPPAPPSSTPAPRLLPLPLHPAALLSCCPVGGFLSPGRTRVPADRHTFHFAHPAGSGFNRTNDIIKKDLACQLGILVPTGKDNHPGQPVTNLSSSTS